MKEILYIAGLLNALLWGCESWNLMRRNLDKLKSFHHGEIRRILNIKWDQVREDHIKKTKKSESAFTTSQTLMHLSIRGLQQTLAK